jgi:hypothetical protein
MSTAKPEMGTSQQSRQWRHTKTKTCLPVRVGLPQLVVSLRNVSREPHSGARISFGFSGEMSDSHRNITT